jgi:hypothetical protein
MMVFTASYFALVLYASALSAAGAHAAGNAGQLSISLASRPDVARDSQVLAQSLAIENVPRNLTIGNDTLPFFVGPIPSPGSLAEKLRQSEANQLSAVPNPRPPYVATVATSQLAAIQSLTDVVGLYDLMAARMPTPIAADNSDANFGRQRLTVKAMKLRRVQPLESLSTCDFQLSNAQLAQVCGPGVTWQNIRARKNLFVEDYADAAKWNDPAKSDVKYVPNVVGFFCYNRDTQKLMPIEIRFNETGLAYSPLDAPDDWTLAKMGLNAASTAYHQWQHLVDTHATSIPIRVELLRTMAPVHPVRTLLQHHMTMDFGLEMLAQVILLAAGTPTDNQFGWGATGSLRFVDYQLRTSNSIKRDFETDVHERGLGDFPIHKYVIYGRRLNDAISAFVKEFLGVYYTSNDAVRDDYELQNWASACAKVVHLADFPMAIRTKTQLEKLVTHLVFLSAVRHHAMNGAATWHAMTVPYSAPALWKKLPTQKLSDGQNRNLMEYAVPTKRVPELLALSALFVRDLAPEQTLLKAYRVAPFVSDPSLALAISEFETRLQKIDSFIQQSESHETVPFDLLRPTNLPANEWV